VRAATHDLKDAVEDGDGARATSINALNRIPANVNVADLDFDPEDPTSHNTYSLGRFLYEGGDTSTMRASSAASGRRGEGLPSRRWRRPSTPSSA
jgi:hypothetical protein